MIIPIDETISQDEANKIIRISKNAICQTLEELEKEVEGMKRTDYSGTWGEINAFREGYDDAKVDILSLLTEKINKLKL